MLIGSFVVIPSATSLPESLDIKTGILLLARSFMQEVSTAGRAWTT